MGLANLEKIVEQITHDKKTLPIPVAIISNGTRRDQRVVTGKLSNIVLKAKQEGIKAPAIIVIGDVVNLRNKLQWFATKAPLLGKRILVARPEHQAAELVGLLKGHGAKVIAVPLIKIVPSGNTAEIKEKLKALDGFDWVIFTSANGVDLFLKALRRHKISLKSLKNKQFAAIGRKTADSLEKNGIPVSLVPKDFIQESLADELVKKAAKSSRILLIHAEGSRPVLEQKLLASGLNVETLGLYKAAPVIENHKRVRKMFARHEIDAVMLTSSSCVESFVSVFDRKQLPQKTKGVTVALIGPISAATAREAGLPVTVESREFTIEGVTNALIDHYTGQKRV
jgi:uroporphyrinogen III methyltransferase/synthase